MNGKCNDGLSASLVRGRDDVSVVIFRKAQASLNGLRISRYGSGIYAICPGEIDCWVGRGKGAVVGSVEFCEWCSDFVPEFDGVLVRVDVVHVICD
jgi:hypothetical protein